MTTPAFTRRRAPQLVQSLVDQLAPAIDGAQTVQHSLENAQNQRVEALA